MCIRLRIMPLSEDWTVTAGRSFLSIGRRILPRAFLVAQLALSGLALTTATAYSASEPRPSSASIRTPDFDESVQWYQDKLGFRLIDSQSLVPGRKAVLERSGFLLEINEADHILPPEPDSTAAVQATPAPVVSLLVPDVDREVERLSRRASIFSSLRRTISTAPIARRRSATTAATGSSCASRSTRGGLQRQRAVRARKNSHSGGNKAPAGCLMEAVTIDLRRTPMKQFLAPPSWPEPSSPPPSRSLKRRLPRRWRIRARARPSSMPRA